LFRDFKVIPSGEFIRELSVHFAAIRKNKAKEAANGSTPAESGKKPISFALYQKLLMVMLKQSDKKYVFASTVMILSWNLMSKNTMNICSSHINWIEDALTILFAHQKNDQYGERRDPRHIYANPHLPHICPILNLAMYLIVYPLVATDPKLFRGKCQYERFRKIMKDFYSLDEVVQVLNNFSIDPNSLGSHSFRKGACTYCTSGSTVCPGGTAIHLRGGWKMPGVDGTYMRWEAAGDQFVGRTVSGLNINSPDFGILPPFFENEELNGFEAVTQVCS